MNTFTGKDLIALGYEPGPHFGPVLEALAKDPGQDVSVLMRKHQPAPKAGLQNFGPYPIYMSVDDQGVKDTMDLVVQTPTVRRAMIMPDACPAGPLGNIPVGGVVATENVIHPGMHSADICCSMMATVFETRSPKEVLDAVHSNTHFGPGGRPEYKMDFLLRCRFENNPFLRDLVEIGDWHMGTQGDGNHFAFVGTNNYGKTVLVTHHGSRGPGAKLYKKGMRVAEKFRQKLSPETLKANAWIPADSQEGQDYYEALSIIHHWTMQNHNTIHSVYIGDQMAIIFNEHNFVSYRDGLFWHYKGSTPMWGFQPKLIPMNMGEPILVVERGDTMFAPHGAGRNMSRTKFLRDADEKELLASVAHLDVRPFSGKHDLSEFPAAYKLADQVREDMFKFNLAWVVDEIRPYGCIMAGDQK